MLKKVMIIGGIAAVLIGISIGLIFLVPVAVTDKNAKALEVLSYVTDSHGDRIHFLNVGGDAILIESEGKFALVDCAEDSDNPRNLASLALNGYEEKVIDYVKKIAADENGKVTIEFIIGTHAHSDHIGGFDSLILDSDITVKKAYIKRYNPERIRDYEIERWDNLEVYNQFIEACEKENVEIIHDTENASEKLGNFDIKILNGEYDTDTVKKGENENSLGVLAEAHGLRAFLAGDINNIDGDETRLGKLIGDVDVLKAGHHGIKKSSTRGFLKKLKPEITVVTSSVKGLNWSVRTSFNAVKTAALGTVENDGVIIEFGLNGLKAYNKIH